MAGNADWVIDADVNNLGTNANGAMLPGWGTEANAQRFPTPAQSGITSTTAETFWTGALSSWAVELVKYGYEVETLPYNGTISYGNSSNVQDLSHYKVFIVDEPNIVFTATEKTALVSFVNNGGGLFIISDHDNSDRNFDGIDSPHIWNDLFLNNGAVVNPFGITFDYLDFSQTTFNVNSLPSDSILHGPYGNPTTIKYSNGTTMVLDPTANPSVTALVYKSGSSHGNANVFLARARYAAGKVVSLGDSSPPDDSTGDVNDALYNSWQGEANGDHARFLMNATIWLATTNSTTGTSDLPGESNSILIYPNPCSGRFSVRLTEPTAPGCRLLLFSILGNEVAESDPMVGNEKMFDLGERKGIFFLKLISGDKEITRMIAVE